MSRLSIKLGLAAATVVVVALAVAFFATGMAYRYLPLGHNFSNTPQSIRIELMPQSSKEWLEKHVTGPDGRDTITYIEYRSGNEGVVQWRNDKSHTMESQTVTTPYGLVLLDAHYGPDGKQVVSGEARRANGTTIWFAADNKDGVVTTTTYWYDGKTVFCVSKRKVGSDQVDEEYFHKSGVPYVKYVGSLSDRTNPTSEQVWNADGKLVYEQTAGQNGAFTVTAYRADGTLWYKQQWTEYTSTGYEGEYGGEYGGGPTTSTVLSETDVYSDDGARVVQQIVMMSGGGTVDHLVDIAKDGSKVVYDLNYSGAVQHIDRFDAAGKKVSGKDVSNGQNMTPDSRFTQSPTAIDPTKVWQQQESDPSTRGSDAP